jgi:adenylate cyclase
MAGFVDELKRRHIYRIGAAYVVVAWLLIQLYNNLTPMLKVPGWAGTLVLLLLIGGFPVALIFAWSLDLDAARLEKAKAAAAAKPPFGGQDKDGHPLHASTPVGNDNGVPGASPSREPEASQIAPSPASPDPATGAGHALPGLPADEIFAPDGASLVVLPFANMSEDPGQDFFADGLTEDIITELSRFRHLFIISRNSSFQYKARPVGVRQVARELNVRYVVEGSVRKAGNRIRVTVQLIDGQSDCHLWAERYDRELADIFALQDEVTAAIVAMLPGRVEAATGERAVRKPTENMTAYECLIAGKLAHHRATAADNAQALRLLDRAIALDPDYAQAHAWKACTLGQAWVNGYAADREATFKKAADELQIALQLNSNDSDVHRILAAVNLVGGEHDRAMYHQERALSLNPNDDLVVVQQGEMLTWIGQPDEGIPWIQKAMRLNPCHPERFWSHLGRAYFAARRYADAVSSFGRITAPTQVHYSWLAASSAQLGDEETAQRYAGEVLKREPGFSVDAFMKTLHYKRPDDITHHRAALLKAGLPQVSQSALTS